MKKYNTPAIMIEMFCTEDILTTSGQGPIGGSTQRVVNEAEYDQVLSTWNKLNG